MDPRGASLPFLLLGQGEMDGSAENILGETPDRQPALLEEEGPGGVIP